MGIMPDQAARVVREVNTSPDRRMPPATRQTLLEDGVQRGLAHASAERAVGQLERAARGLPAEIVATGTLAVPPAYRSVQGQSGAKPGEHHEAVPKTERSQGG